MNDSSGSSSSSSSMCSSSSTDRSSLSSPGQQTSPDQLADQLDVPEEQGTPGGDDYSNSPPRRERLPLAGVQQLFAFLVLRGQTSVTQAAYRVVQRFFNAKIAALCGSLRLDVRLPSLEAVRRFIAPRVRKAWALKVQTVFVPSDGHIDLLPVGVILPSEHVKRDSVFQETFDLFFVAGGRSKEERKWHPEFRDSRMQHERHEVLKDGTVLHSFVIGGVLLHSGDLVLLELADRSVLDGVSVGAGAFAGREAGVQEDDAVHAGDFTLPCSRNGVSIGVLNARHWLPEKHSRITWHPHGHPVTQVMRFTLELYAPRAPPDINELPGRLYRGADGQPSFKLSLALFMDDFVVRAGRSSSAGGVYMLYLSWYFRHRASRYAVRPISLAPPGVDSD